MATIHTVQYSAVQYSTVQYSTVQYSTVQYSTVEEPRQPNIEHCSAKKCSYLYDIVASVGYMLPYVGNWI